MPRGPPAPRPPPFAFPWNRTRWLRVAPRPHRTSGRTRGEGGLPNSIGIPWDPGTSGLWALGRGRARGVNPQSHRAPTLPSLSDIGPGAGESSPFLPALRHRTLVPKMGSLTAVLLQPAGARGGEDWPINRDIRPPRHPICYHSPQSNARAAHDGPLCLPRRQGFNGHNRILVSRSDWGRQRAGSARGDLRERKALRARPGPAFWIIQNVNSGETMAGYLARGHSLRRQVRPVLEDLESRFAPSVLGVQASLPAAGTSSLSVSAAVGTSSGTTTVSAQAGPASVSLATTAPTAGPSPAPTAAAAIGTSQQPVLVTGGASSSPGGMVQVATAAPSPAPAAGGATGAASQPVQAPGSASSATSFPGAAQPLSAAPSPAPVAVPAAGASPQPVLAPGGVACSCRRQR